jgi:hypothetical protein
MSFIAHRLQDVVASDLVRFVVFRLREISQYWILHDGHQRRGLTDCDFTGAHAEITICGGFNPVGVSTESRDIEVRLENLLFIETLL